MTKSVDTLNEACAALAEIRRKLEAGEVEADDLPTTLATAKQAYEAGQSVISRDFELIEELQQAVD